MIKKSFISLFSKNIKIAVNFDRSPRLHSIVSRATTSFRNNPIDILTWIFNVTSFAMDAILCVYLKFLSFTFFDWHIFINSWKNKSIN